ncbi:MAG: hypothetical protein U1E14_14655 [Geminicoccaceae bacterium]
MPLDPSPLQAEASRRNGARSQGPVSSEGKARSSLNATRHGLTARTLDLTEAETEAARVLRDGLLTRFLICDAVEMSALEAFVMAELKLRRIDGLEMEAVRSDAEGVRLRILDRYRGRIVRDHERAERRLMQLVETRPVHGDVNAAQLRFLADLMDAAAAAASDEPEAGAPPPGEPADEEGPSLAEMVAAWRRNEPEPAAAAAPQRPLNRHERRRMERLARKGGWQPPAA